MNLDISVLRISAIILREIQKSRVLAFEALRARVTRKAGEDADLMFVPALSFLYLLGKVEYHLKNDTLEYTDAGARRDAD